MNMKAMEEILSPLLPSHSRKWRELEKSWWETGEELA